MNDPREEIRRADQQARVMSDDDEEVGEPEPSPPVAGADPAVVAECARLDQSDTDNAKRFVLHFGDDHVVVARDGDSGGDWLVWEGRYWDAQSGAAASLKTAQQLGDRIALEIEHLGPSEREADLIKRAGDLGDDDKSAAAERLRKAAETATKRADSRRASRLKFAVSSKNAARVYNILDMAAPHLRRDASVFNADPLLIVTRNATLRIVVEDDLDCPDPDVKRKTARVEVVKGFERRHYATGLVPCDYDPEAKAPKLLAFLDDTMDKEDVRRTLQVYSATGLLGRIEQRVAFHYGSGANGKSVFLAVLMHVLGPSLTVGMPKETIMGSGERGAGQASPDLVRLFGKRMVRIDELKEGEELREDLVKRLTGGDPMVVRSLNSNHYLEFANTATPHMLGNSKPGIKGTDNGIWRRVIVLPWEKTIPEEKRRDFDEIVADLMTERAGILNWLLEGACDYAVNGLFIAPTARLETENYRRDQDPLSGFVETCLTRTPGERLPAERAYHVYECWARVNAREPVRKTKFGLEMSKRFPERGNSGAMRFYFNLALTPEGRELLHVEPPPPEDNER